jgi:hypothetical protein
MNHIIGRTLNPHNRNLSCGGSSGGEGVLIALRASTIGFGTDIGIVCLLYVGSKGTIAELMLQADPLEFRHHFVVFTGSSRRPRGCPIVMLQIR